MGIQISLSVNEKKRFALFIFFLNTFFLILLESSFVFMYVFVCACKLTGMIFFSMYYFFKVTRRAYTKHVIYFRKWNQLQLRITIRALRNTTLFVYLCKLQKFSYTNQDIKIKIFEYITIC